MQAGTGCGEKPAGREFQVAQFLQHLAILDEQAAIGNRQGLVQAIDRVVREGPQRLAICFAEQGERTVLDEEHVILPAQGRQLLHRLGEPQVVDHKEHARTGTTQLRQRLQIRLQIAKDRVKTNGGSGCTDGPHFVPMMECRY